MYCYHQRFQKLSLIIIAISEYEKEIARDLIDKYGVDKDKIATYQPQVPGIHWEEERIVMLRKCISLMKERNVEGDMAEVGVYRRIQQAVQLLFPRTQVVSI